MNRRLLFGSAAVVIAVGGVAGGTQVVPYISSSEIAASAGATIPTVDLGEGSTDLFDDAATHEVSLDIDQTALDELLSTYQEDGEKTWVRATITIDGVTIEDVGVRLKGNSTLRALSGSEGQMPGGMPGGGEQQGQPAMGDEAATSAAEDTATGAAQPAGMELPGGGGMDVGIDESDPATYPLLISFDHYVEGRVYQGRSELSLRPGTPSLNEATALSLTAATGQPTQDFGYVTYSVNDSATTTRLVLENPDENYAAELGNGILYKADATSSFTYQGEDQTEYEGQFNQVNDEGSGDLQPIINLLKWLDEASDEEFAAELGDHVDVESFARYVATQNLLMNQDDMAGPGKNYYLWYDYDTGLISVVSWDLNMTMSGATDTAPTDSVSMSGGMPGDGAPGQQDETATQSMTPPEGMTPPDQAQRPASGELPEGMVIPGQDGGGGMMGGNELKERFLADDAFVELYQGVYWELYDQVYSSGAATATIDQLAASIPVTDGLPAEELSVEVEQLRTWTAQRSEALEVQRDSV
ncbi:CotH kinase family protein [Corynebacterium halotolerans]|uniref:CotH kinase family protein n=1 Tax=Corynebacterium halotolerans TaxID=225326 RepID=UPI003CEF8FC1